MARATGARLSTWTDEQRKVSGAGRHGASRVAALVESLTLDEKASLTAGQDLWTIPGVPRVDIAPVGVTDGPNGARGTTLPGARGPTHHLRPVRVGSRCHPDPELIHDVGALLGAETRAKGCRVLLAPTVNIPRSPLAGRNFECYSEDPLLSGVMAAAFIEGVQSQDVATTVKHFVGNDAEFERYTMSSLSTNAPSARSISCLSNTPSVTEAPWGS